MAKKNKEFTAKNEDGQPVDGGVNTENTEVTPTEKKRGRVAGTVGKNQNLAIVIGESVSVTSFTKKTDLAKWCAGNLEGGVESLTNDKLVSVDGSPVLLVYGHILKAQTKVTTRVVL